MYPNCTEREPLRFFIPRVDKKAFFCLEADMSDKLTRQDCISLLEKKYLELGQERYPQRSDFAEHEVVAIKAHLGPWPRALEAAGIKAPRQDDHAEKNRQKRIRAKRARTAARAAKKGRVRDGVLDQKQTQKEKENTP